MLLKTGQKLLFIGDSITDCGRRTDHVPYGNGYVSIVRNMLCAKHPELRLTIVNQGIGRNTTRDLRERWTVDVLQEQPDWVTVMIGINDVRRAFRNRVADAVPLPEYTAILRDLVGQTQRQTPARLIMMTPYMIEPDRANPMRQQMELYGSAVEAIADEHQALFISTQAAFHGVLEYSTPEDWSDDQIHPNSAGHTVIALAWLKAVGFTL